MFELSVEREFCAAHAINIGGAREPVHGHNWRVTAVVVGDRLDANGLLCDFHLIEKRLDEIIAAFHNCDLNATAPFDRINPTVEHVAQFIAEQLSPTLPRQARLDRVRVTEAPGCTATFIAND